MEPTEGETRGPRPGETAQPGAGTPAGAGAAPGRWRRLVARGHGDPRYRVLSEIAEGGMGRVLRVWDVELERELAMKCLRQTAGERTEARLARFLEEARLTSRLDHPGIVPVHEIGHAPDGSLYFTMPLVRGRDLAAVFALVRSGAGGWSLPRAVGVLLKVCETVAFAHSRGVVHRDLKPANVMVGPFGEAYVMDWGLAKLAGAGEGGRVVGTPAYMAPEQARGREADVGPRSDVYSLGAILYELCSGRMPHERSRASSGRDLGALIGSPPAPLRTVAPDVPAELAAITAKAMDPDPEQRYASALAMAEDLRAWLEGRVVRAHGAGPFARARKWVARNRALAFSLEALVALAVLAVGAILWQQSRTIHAIAAERARTELNGYAANLRAADLGLRVHETDEAKRRLEACPADLRGWEWRHLVLRADTSLARLRGNVASIRAVAASADGALLATGSDDGAVRTWDARDGTPLAVLAGHDKPVRALAFSPDARRLASGSQDRRIAIWDVERGDLERYLEVGSDGVRTLAFCGGGELVAGGSHDGSIRIWRVADGHPLGRFGDGDAVLALAASPGGELLAAGHADGSLVTWDVAELAPRARFAAESSISALAWSPVGSRIACTTSERRALVLAARDLALDRELEPHEGYVFALAWSPGGDELVGGCADNSLLVWDVESGAIENRLLGHDDDVAAVAFLRDGRVASGSEDLTVRLWDPGASAFTVLSGHEEAVTSLAWLDGGARLVSGSRDGTLRLWDGTSGEPLARVERAGVVDALAEGGGRLALASLTGVAILDAASFVPLSELAGHPRDVFALAFDPEGERLLSRGTGLDLRLWDAASGGLLLEIELPPGLRGAIAFAPDGATFVSGDADGVLRVRDARTGAVLLARDAGTDTANIPTATITAIAWAPSGRLLASGSFDRTVRVWTMPDLRLAATLRGHGGQIACLAFTPDGERLASGSTDQTVRIWDPRSGESLLTLRGHEDLVSALAFRPDGAVLASASVDRTLRLWRTLAGPPAR